MKCLGGWAREFLFVFLLRSSLVWAVAFPCLELLLQKTGGSTKRKRLRFPSQFPSPSPSPSRGVGSPSPSPLLSSRVSHFPSFQGFRLHHSGPRSRGTGDPSLRRRALLRCSVPLSIGRRASHSSYHNYATVQQCVEVRTQSLTLLYHRTMAKLPILARSAIRKPNETMRLIVVTTVGVVLGFFIGISFPTVSITKLHFPSSVLSHIDDKDSGLSAQALLNHAWIAARNARGNASEPTSNTTVKIYVPTNPKGAESLPPGIVVPESDFHHHRLWGNPDEDLPFKPKYLVTFTVGISQKENINRAVKKFSENFAILLFHYDGRVSEWDEFEWSKRAIHISVRRQAKWWYAKRFLHPDIVAPYEYIFIWDEDLGVEHFNAEEYIKLVKKYQLEISQPGLEPDKGLTWQMTKRRGDLQVHKDTEEREGWCSDPRVPPCAAFVEIMAPVFSRDSWRCVWHMIQNDLVHGWGLDFALRKCVEPAHEKIGVVDSQWIVHQVVPSLGNQGQAEQGKAPWEGVRERCRKEWGIFQTRMAEADKAYYKMMGVTPPNVTFVS